MLHSGDPSLFLSREEILGLNSNKSETKKAPSKKEWIDLSKNDGDLYSKISIDGARRKIFRQADEEIKCLIDSFIHKTITPRVLMEIVFGPESQLASHFLSQYQIDLPTMCQFLATCFVGCRFNDSISSLYASELFRSDGLMPHDEYIDEWKIFDPPKDGDMFQAGKG